MKLILTGVPQFDEMKNIEKDNLEINEEKVR